MMLEKLLKEKNITGSLYNLHTMAMKASRDYRAGDAFKALHNAFCDGVEVCISNIMSAKVGRSKFILTDCLQKRLQTLTIKNILVQARGKKTVLWITFTSDSNRIDPRTMTQLTQLQSAVV